MGSDPLVGLLLPVALLEPLVPEPVEGSVLVLERVPVSLPIVEPVIELSLPLPPVEGEADELEPVAVDEVSIPVDCESLVRGSAAPS